MDTKKLIFPPHARGRCEVSSEIRSPFELFESEDPPFFYFDKRARWTSYTELSLATQEQPLGYSFLLVRTP